MEGTELFEPRPGLPERLARPFRRPFVAGATVGVAGYVVMTLLLVALGLVLVNVLLDGPVGRWDDSVNRWFVQQRTPTLDDLTVWGSWLGDTLTVIGIAAVAVVILAIARLWARIAFLVGALLIEVTTFVTTAFLVERPRPAVRQLDAVPPTSSFPSGHTAASIVLYVGLALIVTSLVRNILVRVVVWSVAIGRPDRRRPLAVVPRDASPDRRDGECDRRRGVSGVRAPGDPHRPRGGRARGRDE